MRKTIKRVIAGVLLLVTMMSSFAYGLEFDELYRGENLGALWYSEFDSDGTGVNQMEGLVYIDGELTAVPAVCINPDVPGMAEFEYGDLYKLSDILYYLLYLLQLVHNNHKLQQQNLD